MAWIVRDLCESPPVLNMAHSVSVSEPRHLYCEITVKSAVVYWQLDSAAVSLSLSSLRDNDGPPVSFSLVFSFETNYLRL